MLRRNLVKVKELRLRATPATAVGRAVGVDVGLVPDFPVRHIQLEAVRPALVVVADDVLTDARPLVKIRRRDRAMLFNLMLNRLPEAEEGFCTRIQRHQNAFIGASEVVGSGIVFVGLKPRENSGDVVRIRAAVDAVNRRIVVAGIRHTRRLVILKITAPLVSRVALVPRTAVGGVENLERAFCFARIKA